jgi:hypothetical protein
LILLVQFEIMEIVIIARAAYLRANANRSPP